MNDLFFGNDGICFEIIDALYINRPKMKKFYTERRNFCTLSIRLKGSGSFSFENEKINVNENDILFCPSSINYCQTTKGEQLIAIHLMIYGDYKFKPEKITVSQKAQETFYSIYELYQRKETGYKYRSNAILNCFLAEFSVNSSWGKYYIERNLSNANLNVKDLARHELVSEQYFRKKFKSLYGVSPKQYIQTIRIERAKVLLDTKYYKINEVARLVGIEDCLYFCSLFKKHVGVCPSKYRNQSNQSKF